MESYENIYFSYFCIGRYILKLYIFSSVITYNRTCIVLFISNLVKLITDTLIGASAWRDKQAAQEQGNFTRN